MTVEEFKKIFNHIVKNSYGRSLQDNSAEYYGTYNGTKVTAKYENLGMDRYLEMNGKKYYASHIWGEYSKGVMEL